MVACRCSNKTRAMRNNPKEKDNASLARSNPPKPPFAKMKKEKAE